MTEGKAEGVPFFFTGRCLVGRVGAVAPDTAPPLGTQPGLPERKSGTDKRGGTGVARDGPLSARKEHGTETKRRQHSAPAILPRRREQSRKATPTPRRSLRPARGGGVRRGRGGLEAGPRQGLVSRCLMGIVVLGTSQDPPADTGNYVSRQVNGFGRLRVKYVAVSAVGSGAGERLPSQPGRGFLFLPNLRSQAAPALSSLAPQLCPSGPSSRCQFFWAPRGVGARRFGDSGRFPAQE